MMVRENLWLLPRLFPEAGAWSCPGCPWDAIPRAVLVRHGTYGRWHSARPLFVW